MANKSQSMNSSRWVEAQRDEDSKSKATGGTMIRQTIDRHRRVTNVCHVVLNSHEQGKGYTNDWTKRTKQTT